MRKQRSASGAWGPWSCTWSFTAKGPAYPLDIAIEHNVATGIGTLTWRANPVGRPPAAYRVYGSDEKGFTVHDTPYAVKFGRDQRAGRILFRLTLWPKSPALPWPVLGLGQALPNANKAYYRVVAVDRDGKRSGDRILWKRRGRSSTARRSRRAGGPALSLPSEGHPFPRRSHQKRRRQAETWSPILEVEPLKSFRSPRNRVG